jgi:hypothetical protein
MKETKKRVIMIERKFKLAITLIKHAPYHLFLQSVIGIELKITKPLTYSYQKRRNSLSISNIFLHPTMEER